MTTELIQLYDTVSEKIGKDGATALANYITKFTNERLNANLDNLVDKPEFHKEVAEIRMDIADVRVEVKNVYSELKQDIADVRNEIGEVRSELKQDIADVRNEIANVRSELKQDIADVRNEIAEVRTDIAAVRTEMVILKTDLQSEIKDGFSKMNRVAIQWLIGLFASLITLILTLYFNR